MNYDGVNSIVCDAEENDWLDVSYSERKYVEQHSAAKQRKFKFGLPKIKINKKFAVIAGVAVLCVALMACLLFIDGNFSKDVFNAVKTAYSSAIFGVEPTPVAAKIAIPANVNLVDVKEGVATFNGGRATLSFTAGKITEVGEDFVKVAIDDATTITYNQLTEIYVKAGDSISANALIGKYKDSFTTVLTVGGEAVTDVVASEKQLTWNV